MQLLKAALAEYDTKEVPGADSNARILEYAKSCGQDWYQSDDTSWCGIFMGFCASKVGADVPTKPATAGHWLKVGNAVQNLEDFALLAQL